MESDDLRVMKITTSTIMKLTDAGPVLELVAREAVANVTAFGIATHLLPLRSTVVDPEPAFILIFAELSRGVFVIPIVADTDSLHLTAATNCVLLLETRVVDCTEVNRKASQSRIKAIAQPTPIACAGAPVLVLNHISSWYVTGLIIPEAVAAAIKFSTGLVFVIRVCDTQLARFSVIPMCIVGSARRLASLTTILVTYCHFRT